MKRAASFLASLGLLLMPSFLWAQNLQNPDPPSSSDLFGPELIAWSQLQKPQRVPQPLPDSPAQQHETRAANPQAQQQTTLRAFTGRIIIDGNRYALQVSKDVLYQLDDQQRASQCDGKQVKVLGTLPLDEGRYMVHVTGIKPIS
jgi:hypothetical protein